MVFLQVDNPSNVNQNGVLVANGIGVDPSTNYDAVLERTLGVTFKAKAIESFSVFVKTSQASMSMLVEANGGSALDDAEYGSVDYWTDIKNNLSGTASVSQSISSGTTFSTTYSGSGIAESMLVPRLNGNDKLGPYKTGDFFDFYNLNLQANSPYLRTHLLFGVIGSKHSYINQGLRLDEVGTTYEPFASAGNFDKLLYNQFNVGAFVSQTFLQGPPAFNTGDGITIEINSTSIVYKLNGVAFLTKTRWVKYRILTLAGVMLAETTTYNEGETVDVDFDGIGPGSYYLEALCSTGQKARQRVDIKQPKIVLTPTGCIETNEGYTYVIEDIGNDTFDYANIEADQPTAAALDVLSEDSIVFPTPWSLTGNRLKVVLDNLGEYVYSDVLTGCLPALSTKRNTTLEVDMTEYDDCSASLGIGYNVLQVVNGTLANQASLNTVFDFVPTPNYLGAAGVLLEKKIGNTIVGTFLLPISVIPDGNVCQRTVNLPDGQDADDYEFGYSTTNNASGVIDWQDSPTFTFTQDGTYYFFARPKTNTACASAGLAVVVTGCNG